MDLCDMIDGIKTGENSPDELASLIPELVKMHHRQLPEMLAYILINEYWRRWGFPDPVTYLNVIGIPDHVVQQVTVVVRECVASVAQRQGAGTCRTV